MRVIELDVLQRRTLVWAGLAVVLTAFDGSVLVLALPAIASDFNAQIPGLSNLGSVLALGSLGALPLATFADRFGRRRLIAIGVAGFSIANFASAFAPSLTALSLIRMVAVCFEALVAGVATALIVEEAPPGRRGQAVSVLAVLGGLGAGHGSWLPAHRSPLAMVVSRGRRRAVAAPASGCASQRTHLDEGRPSGSALKLLAGGRPAPANPDPSATTALITVLLSRQACCSPSSPAASCT